MSRWNNQQAWFNTRLCNKPTNISLKPIFELFLISFENLALVQIETVHVVDCRAGSWFITSFKWKNHDKFSATSIDQLQPSQLYLPRSRVDSHLNLLKLLRRHQRQVVDCSWHCPSFLEGVGRGFDPWNNYYHYWKLQPSFLCRLCASQLPLPIDVESVSRFNEHSLITANVR